MSLGPTWLRRACSLETVLSHLMSEMMIATIKLTMMTVPKTIKPTNKSIVKRRVIPDSESSEFVQRSSNSNSPRIITKIFRKDLQTLLKESVLLPK